MATTLERLATDVPSPPLAPPPFNADQPRPRPAVRPTVLPWWRTDAVQPATRWWPLASLGLVAVLASFFYIWNLGQNGYANEYYAAAVLSMTQTWKAFFFGSIDSVGIITVDKPPFAFWVQALSARIFGFSSWSILLPQALAGLAAVLAVFHLARQRFGTVAATIASLVLIATPITVAVTRDNNPDTMLVLLLVGGAWGTLSALRSGRLLPLLIGAALVGFAFNTKMLQAFIVVPAFVLTYFFLAPGSLRRRLGQLLAAGAVLAVVSASWMAIVDSIPADLRPYIGGSSDGTVLDLVLGYNGLGRILGRNATTVLGVASAGQGANFGGAAGWARLFGVQVGGQISWLLPLSAVALVAGLISCLGQPRTDARRAWYVLWGGWLATHFVVFSLAEGTFHPYYTTALAPAIAALCGPGLVAMWGLYRRSWWTAWLLPASIGMTAAWSYALLSRSAWLPWLKLVVVGAAVVAIVGLLVARFVRTRSGHTLARAAAVIGLVAILAGPAAWSTTPLTSAVNGTNPTAGPADASQGGFGGGPGGAPMGGGFGGGTARASQPGTGNGAQGPGAGTRSRGTTTQPADGGTPSQPTNAQIPSFDGQPQTDGGFAPDGMDGGMPGGFGGPGGQASTELMNYLVANRGDAAFLVAVSGANSAAPIILATHQPVLAMGGFTGSDPAPTLAQLQAMAASGQLRFILLGGGGPGRSSNDIQQWVQANGTLVDASTYGGSSNQQLYDLSSTMVSAS